MNVIDRRAKYSDIKAAPFVVYYSDPTVKFLNKPYGKQVVNPTYSSNELMSLKVRLINKLFE